MTLRSRRRRLYYYVSDYGWGHASRAIALIRCLLAQDPNLEITVDGQAASWLLETSLRGSERVAFRHTRKDPGLKLIPGTLSVDRAATNEQFFSWLTSWPEYVKKETEYCQATGQQLIVSDVAPQPFLVADRVGIPSVAVTNFTWHEVYRELLGDSAEMAIILAAYQKASLAVILPMAIAALPFPRTTHVPLVSRVSTRTRDEIRASLGVSRDDCLIFVSLGKSVPHEQPALRRLANVEGIRFLLGAHVSSGNVRAARIPSDEAESQDYVAACDVIVTKCGYSSISEAIVGRVPILAAARSGMVEDGAIVHAIRSLGIGDQLSEAAMMDGRWLGQAIELARNEPIRYNYTTLPPAYSESGNEPAARAILDELERQGASC